MDFKTLKEYAKKWTAVGKGTSSFCKSKEIWKKKSEKYFACEKKSKKNKRKKRCRHWETVNRIEREKNICNFGGYYKKEWRFVIAVFLQCWQVIESHE